MESKKINQLATNVAPQTSDLTIIGDPVTGVSKKITLLQIANLFATTGTVSSVAVTETGEALTITGSPITSTGTINISFAGNANQYVRGDGALSDFPTSTGGGSSVSYYLNSSVSQGTIGGNAYRQLSKQPIIGAGTDITISANGYVANYITNANDPSLLEVPGGNFNCEFYFSVNSNAHNPYVYAELYKYDGTTFTLLGSSQSIPEYLSNGSTLSAYYFAVPVATAALTITDRLAIRIYVNVDTRIVTLHTENGHLCQVVTTFSKGMVSLNNLTKQTQFLATGTSGTNFAIVSSGDTHTFNLPVASAANTGKLSSTDWSTFNNKVPYTGATTNVNLGTNSLFAYDLFANGNGTNNANLYLKQGTVSLLIQNGYSNILATGTKIGFQVATSAIAAYYADFQFSSLTAQRTYTLPDASGTLALTSNLSAYITLTSLSAGAGISYNNTTGVITSTITQYTDALARAAISLTTTGTSGAATYNSTTGVFNIPQYQGNVTSFNTRTGAITLLSADVTGALGFTPYNATNPSGFITSSASISGTSAGVVNTVAGTNTVELVRGNMADNDQFRILVGGTDTNAGYAEIATADDGTEPIYVRQYTGVFSTLVRTATLLDGSGNTSFPNNLSAANFSGTSSGTNTGDQTLAGLGGLPLAGGTLTGPLSGTTATFSGLGTFYQLTMTGATAGRLFYAQTGGVVSQSGNLNWNETNGMLGVGTSNPSAIITAFSTNGATQFKAAGTAPAFTFSNTLTSSTLACVFGLATASNHFITGTAAGDMAIANQSTVAGSIVFGTGTTERMRMSAAGRFLINTSVDNGASLQVNGATTLTGALSGTSASFNGTGLTVLGNNSQVTSAIYQTIASNDSDTGLLIKSFSTAYYPFIRFNQGSSGKLEFGITGSGDAFGGGNFYLNFNTASGSTGAALKIASTGAATFSSLGTGTVTATSGTLSTVSDMNLKDEDGFIDNALDKVMNLKPRYYHWKEESGLPTDLRQLGFYAQEVNEALGEEAANTPKTENDKWGIYDRGMIAFLTAAIQEQQAQIAELKALIAAK